MKNSLSDALFEAINSELEQYVQKRPDVVALASVASLARIIEPELLRSLRLNLSAQFKGVQVSVDSESALWFSSFVESRGAGGITLLPEAVQIFRPLLTKDPQLLEAAYKIIEGCHEFASDVLQWEERIVYFALTGQQSRIEEEALRGVRSISKEIRLPLVSWINDMWNRLPPEACNNPLMIKLNQLALGFVLRRVSGKNDLGTFDTNVVLDFSSFPTRDLGVVFEDDHFLIGDIARAKLGIQVPDLEPIELEMISPKQFQPLVIPRGNFVEIKALETVRIRSLDGQIYQLDPQLFILGSTKVFVSYSHDNPEHKERVLGVSNRLREDGIETRFDQYVNGTPEQTWPRWTFDQLDWADYVLCICTETYYRRYRGHDVSGGGKGVDWEGDLFIQKMYSEKSRTKKFVPVVFEQPDAHFIPEPLRGNTFFVLNSEAGYERLCNFLLDQANKDERATKTKDVRPTTSSDSRPSDQKLPEPENGNPSDPYSVLNDDLPIKKIVSNKIQLILNKDLLKKLRDNLCGTLCKTIDDTAAKRLVEILVDLPILEAIIKLEDAVREFFDPADMTQKQKEQVFAQWQLCLDILGWLLLLTVNPEWRKKHRSTYSNGFPLNFKLSVTDKTAADIAVASVTETSADVARRGIKRLYGCCDIGIELGIFPLDTAEIIAKVIYRALFKKEPDTRKDYLEELNADLLAYATRDRLRYLTIDSNHRDNPLNDETTFTELKKLLPNLSIIHIGVHGNGVEFFLIPELHVLQNIRQFLEIGSQLKGL